ncbi:MAG: leucine-rich repeat protein [Bacteroidales bacterium]|nr:leucine-rich repeat protein [Bacteroidales bacterium]
MKTLKCMILFACLLSALTAQAFEFTVDDFTYYTTGADNSTVCLSGYIVEPEGDLVIPSNVIYEGKSYPITSIGLRAFGGCTELTSVTISEGIISIGIATFDYCKNLLSIALPSTLINIGIGAFDTCEKLTSITLPNGFTSIADRTFYACSNLSSITIPASLTSIGREAFKGCTSLASITIPEGVISIGEESFAGCSSIVSITIPSSITSMGLGTFSDCISLSSIYLSEGVSSIGKWAFSGCTVITSVTIPSSVISIGDFSFFKCKSLTSISFSEGLDSIGEDAFCYCDNLTSIHIPEGVTSIGAGAFAACKQLASVTLPSSVTSIAVCAFSGSCILSQFVVSESNPLYATEGLALFTKDKKSLLSFPSGRVKQYIVPSGVEVISSYAFYDSYSLASIEIPKSVTLIGEYAFFGCDSLRKVYVGNLDPPAIEDLKTIIGIRNSCTLYVPIGSKEAYATADGWKDFQYIEETNFAVVPTSEESPFSIIIDGEGITITGVKPGASITVYTIMGTKLLTLPATGDKQRIALSSGGIYFVKVGNQVKKIIL